MSDSSNPGHADARLDALARNWEQFGRDDPLWAVLTEPDKRGGRWDPAAFYATGRAEIDALHERLAGHGIAVAPGAALDFGCGAGRLAAALAARHARVTAVDISASMLDAARRALAPLTHVAWMHETSGALPQVPGESVDFLYSNFTLQHIPPPYNARYVAEFLRVLKPGGIAVFDVPDRNDASLRGLVVRYAPRFALNALRRVVFRTRAVMEMHGLREAAVRELVAANGGVVRAAWDSSSAGPGWIGRCYAVEKRRAAS